MRIVLDTNVALSALLWRGTPYRLLQSVRRQTRVWLFTSPILLEELADVLSRQFAARRLVLIGRAGHEVLRDYADSVELVTPGVTPLVISADPDDDHVIAAATAAEADFIVSGDRHLLELATYESIKIITAIEAVARIDTPFE